MSCKDVLAILNGAVDKSLRVCFGWATENCLESKGKKKIKCAQCDIPLVSWGEFLMRSCFSTILRGTRQHCVHLSSCILMTAAACYCQDIKCPFFHWQGPQILPIGHAPILLFRHVAWKNHFNVNQPAHTFLEAPHLRIGTTRNHGRQIRLWNIFWNGHLDNWVLAGILGHSRRLPLHFAWSRGIWRATVAPQSLESCLYESVKDKISSESNIKVQSLPQIPLAFKNS